jgi:hypothetical protein
MSGDLNLGGQPERLVLARLRTDACFHFGFHPSVTQENLAAPNEAPVTRNRLI